MVYKQHFNSVGHAVNILIYSPTWLINYRVTISLEKYLRVKKNNERNSSAHIWFGTYRTLRIGAKLRC